MDTATPFRALSQALTHTHSSSVSTASAPRHLRSKVLGLRPEESEKHRVFWETLQELQAQQGQPDTPSVRYQRASLDDTIFPERKAKVAHCIPFPSFCWLCNCLLYFVCMCACVHVCVCVAIHVLSHTHTHTHAHTHAHTHTLSLCLFVCCFAAPTKTRNHRRGLHPTRHDQSKLGKKGQMQRM